MAEEGQRKELQEEGKLPSVSANSDANAEVGADSKASDIDHFETKEDAKSASKGIKKSAAAIHTATDSTASSTNAVSNTTNSVADASKKTASAAKRVVNKVSAHSVSPEKPDMSYEGVKESNEIGVDDSKKVKIDPKAQLKAGSLHRPRQAARGKAPKASADDMSENEDNQSGGVRMMSLAGKSSQDSFEVFSISAL